MKPTRMKGWIQYRLRGKPFLCDHSFWYDIPFYLFARLMEGGLLITCYIYLVGLQIKKLYLSFVHSR